MKNNMIKCENCLKSDVCGKMEKVKGDLEKLKLTAEFQKLENNNIYINISCNNYLEKAPKILARGE